MTTTLTTCCHCGTEFPAMSADFTIGGKAFTIGQSLCDPCQSAKEEELETQSRGSHAAGRPAWEEICPEAYRGFKMEKLPVDSRHVAFKALEWQWNPKGVGLIGDSRAGKTFIMHELARRIYVEGGKIKLTSGTEFAYACGSSEAGERRAMIDSCISVSHLFLDDIDKMKMTDRVESDFYHVIEQRRRAMKPVFVTLNASGAELTQKMSANGGDPIVNRLRHDVCEFYAV